ncbi:MAG: AmmeMemoRadiSam system radical SAM enzyme, partial [Desulfobacteraceae bacterium]|nr:AmmeMemoRadiSam system radical SAM enzyme [Desulfobacteraceae bacterium]
METLIYEQIGKKKVKCGICSHFCIIEEGKRGLCCVRENQGGKLYSLVYSKLIATSIDPIEKKPVFHLKPGSYSYSIATVGCNFKCVFCQNANIAQMPGDHQGLIQGKEMTPAKIVDQAVKTGCASISYTYTEPTVYFELAFETAKLAKAEGLLNIFVTNGFMSAKALEMVAPYLDAANVDLKSFSDKFYQKYCKARLEPVKENLKAMKALGILKEITTLVIPSLNDDIDEIRAMASFIHNELGSETPWHISRFHPSYKLDKIGPTPVQTLEKIYQAGKDAGLKYVYTGNAPGLASENTYCHACDTVLIKRHGYDIE